MRAWSIVLLLLGFFLLAHSTYDECRGITHKPLTLVGGRRHDSSYLYRIPVKREQNPELFRKFMTTHWIYAGLISGLGCGLLVTSLPPREPN